MSLGEGSDFRPGRSLHPACSVPTSPAKEPSVFCAALIACEGTGGRGALMDLGCQISSLNLGMGPFQIISPSFLKGFFALDGAKIGVRVCHFRITSPPVNQHSSYGKLPKNPSMFCLFKLFFFFHSYDVSLPAHFPSNASIFSNGFPGLRCLSTEGLVILMTSLVDLPSGK